MRPHLLVDCEMHSRRLCLSLCLSFCRRYHKSPHFLIMSEVTHTAAEIRAKRLAALEGRGSSNAMTGAAAVPAAAAAGSQQAPQRRAELKTTSEIICIDSDSEDEKPAAASARSKRARSEDSTDRTRKQPPAADIANANAQSLSASSSSSRSVFPFRMTTYNVWFGQDGDAEPYCERRMNAIASLITQEPNTWFAGFQEVTMQSFPVIAQAMQRAGYTLVPQTNLKSLYFCVLAVRQLSTDGTILDSGWVDFTTTGMSRGFCYARLRLRGRDEQILVATTHLESFVLNATTGVQERAAQLLEFTEFARQEMKTHKQLQWVALMGDLNWDDESKSAKDTAVADLLNDCRMPWKDAWLQTQQKKSDKCYTYDGRLNPMLSNSMRRRFDRTLLFSRQEGANKQLQVVSTKLVGQDAFPGLTFFKKNPFTGGGKIMPVAPSDHFGFVSELKIDLS